MTRSKTTHARSFSIHTVALYIVALCTLAVAIAAIGNPAVAAGDADRPLAPIAAKLQADRMVTYKRIGSLELKLHLFMPDQSATPRGRAAFVIFHGGGWTAGNARRVYPFADYFRRQGLVSIAVQYRLVDRQRLPNVAARTTVFDCVKDGRSAIRYLRQNADQLGIDPERIVVAGCSAGGHLAVGTALFDQVNDASDDQSICCEPNALVLYYPVIDTSPQGYGQRKIGGRWKQISPLHQVRAEQSPTLIFHGTADTVTPYSGAVAFEERMSAVGNRCELISHAGGIHGHVIFDLKLFDDAMNRTKKFLIDIGIVSDQGTSRLLRSDEQTHPESLNKP